MYDVATLGFKITIILKEHLERQAIIITPCRQCYLQKIVASLDRPHYTNKRTKVTQLIHLRDQKKLRIIVCLKLYCGNRFSSSIADFVLKNLLCLYGS